MKFRGGPDFHGATHQLQAVAVTSQEDGSEARSLNALPGLSRLSPATSFSLLLCCSPVEES